MGRNRALQFTVIGFLLVHLIFAGFSFAQLWMVRERGFDAATIAVCGPFMIAYRFVPADSPFFYVGMCAASFLPLALYGPANSLIQGLTPAHMRSTMAGLTMTVINVFALALGTVVTSAVVDRLGAAGDPQALTLVLLATDALALCSGLLFWLAARQLRLGKARVDLNVSPTLAH